MCYVKKKKKADIAILEAQVFLPPHAALFLRDQRCLQNMIYIFSSLFFKVFRSLLLTFRPEGVVRLHKHIHIYSDFLFISWTLMSEGKKIGPQEKWNEQQNCSNFWNGSIKDWIHLLVWILLILDHNGTKHFFFLVFFFWTSSSYESTNKTLTAPECIYDMGFWRALPAVNASDLILWRKIKEKDQSGNINYTPWSIHAAPEGLYCPLLLISILYIPLLESNTLLVTVPHVDTLQWRKQRVLDCLVQILTFKMEPAIVWIYGLSESLEPTLPPLMSWSQRL